MDLLIHFDIAAFIILSIIFITNVYRKLYKDISSKIFLLLIGVIILASMFEMAQIIVYACGCRNDLVFMLIKSIYLLTHNLATFVYYLYIISIARRWNKLQERPIIALVMILPAIADFVMVAVNCFTGFMFVFQEGIIIWNNQFPVYFSATIYVAASIAYIIKNRIVFKRHQMLALASMLPLSILAITVNILLDRTLVAIFSNAVGVMIMSTVIQRPEEIIDTTTQLRKYDSYADDLNKVFYNKHHVNVILVNIVNYNALYNLVGYSEMNKILRSIANELYDINRQLNAFADIYYLDRGRFRIIINSFNKDKVKKFAFEVNEILKKQISVKQIDTSINAAVCIARCPEDIGDFSEMMYFGADYHNKTHLSGDVIIAEDLFKQKNFGMINDLDDIIDKALREGNLQVYYQPIYSVAEQRFTSAEALIRLIDDVHGFVPPDIFIPAAEKSGAIRKIGSFVLNDVCRFIASDQFKGLGLDYIEINLSVAQCMQADLADEVLGSLAHYKVKASQINLEITETAVNYNMSIMSDNLIKLSESGISFSLDDFGTGYSNMERVASLPLKIVKLDRSFVNSQHKPKMSIFLENFIRMFKDMNMEIVVEGIETDTMVKRFSDLKCDYIQGYYFSKPLPEQDFVEFISSRRSA